MAINTWGFRIHHKWVVGDYSGISKYYKYLTMYLNTG